MVRRKLGSTATAGEIRVVQRCLDALNDSLPSWKSEEENERVVFVCIQELAFKIAADISEILMPTVLTYAKIQLGW